jgi:hypothetical protein
MKYKFEVIVETDDVADTAHIEDSIDHAIMKYLANEGLTSEDDPACVTDTSVNYMGET